MLKMKLFLDHLADLSNLPINKGRKYKKEGRRKEGYTLYKKEGRKKGGYRKEGHIRRKDI
jgi:hypothetical protein